MAQHDYVIDNQTSAQFRVDLNNALAAIVSQNSGDTEPATPFASQVWYDTLNNLLKQRNESNSAWTTLGTVNEGTGKFEPNQTFATQAEAEAGTVDTVAMTPLKTAQAIAALSTSGGGGYDAQIFTGNGTWTKPAGAPSTARVRVQIWGGGGGAGRETNYVAGAGGGGGYNEYNALAGDLAATVSVTVGAGGAGRTGSHGNGNAGGISSFGIYGAEGGGGGNGGNSGTSPSNTSGTGGGVTKSGTLVAYMGGWTGGGGSSRNSVFGGAAGGGTSVYGGSSNTAPAGGGTSSGASTNGNNGQRGEVRVYTTW